MHGLAKKLIHKPIDLLRLQLLRFFHLSLRVFDHEDEIPCSSRMAQPSAAFIALGSSSYQTFPILFDMSECLF